jgi:hypothetical protein
MAFNSSEDSNCKSFGLSNGMSAHGMFINAYAGLEPPRYVKIPGINALYFIEVHMLLFSKVLFVGIVNSLHNLLL